MLVCSDGITGDWAHQVLSDTEFADAFGQDDPQASADRFIQLSKKDDDKTAIVLFVGEKGDTTSGEPEAPVADELDLPQDEPESDDPDELDKPFWGDDEEAELEAQRKRTALGIAQRRELERQEAERTVNPASIRLSRAQKMAARVVGLVAKMYVNCHLYTSRCV